MLFSSSALLGRPVDETHLFEGASALLDSGIFLSFPSGVHAFLFDIALHSIFQGIQLECGQAYLAYHQNVEVD